MNEFLCEIDANAFKLRDNRTEQNQELAIKCITIAKYFFK